MMRPRRLFALVLLGGAVVLLALHPAVRSALAPRDRSVVTVRDEAQVRAAFNAQSETTRVVAWLSPT